MSRLNLFSHENMSNKTAVKILNAFYAHLKCLVQQMKVQRAKLGPAGWVRLVCIITVVEALLSTNTLCQYSITHLDLQTKLKNTMTRSIKIKLLFPPLWTAGVNNKDIYLGAWHNSAVKKKGNFAQNIINNHENETKNTNAPYHIDY